MNKKLILLVLLLIGFSFVYQANITGHSIYYTGDSFESDGRTITIEKISQSNAVINVNGIKMLISAGDKKNIEGVDIEIMGIFYVSEPEARNVDLSINITGNRCGDGECKENENSENCCIDCECPEDYRCKDNKCVYRPPPECKKHEDCDDGDPKTIDLCVDDITKICRHYTEPGEEIEQEIEETEEELEQEEIEETEKQGFFSRLIMFLKKFI